MTAGAEFKQKVLMACCDALQRQGFTRYRKENVDWPLAEGFHCWVGLNTASCSEYIELNPFVGIHASKIMKMYTYIEGRKYDRSIATYPIHVGDIAPREDVFHFYNESDLAVTSERLARIYATAGLAYAQSISSYSALLPLLNARVEMLGGYPERVACCLYLMGRVRDARSFAEDFLQKERPYFEGFAVPFLQMLAGQER